MGKIIDLKGKFFGEWEVLEKAPSRNKKVMWLCKCSCGTIKEVRSEHLRSGASTSCGCVQKQKAAATCEEVGKMNKKDWMNKKVDFLTVIQETPDRSQNGSIIWKCLCDCGNIVYKSSSDLARHKSCHCGCQTITSQGELTIRNLLTDNNILFEEQKTFLDCKDLNPLPFDFYVNNEYVIEYDGKQHFKPSEYWGGEKQLKYIQKHDVMKNEWCKENNIPIIRIPYTHKSIQIEDLIPQTSKFLII